MPRASPPGISRCEMHTRRIVDTGPAWPPRRRWSTRRPVRCAAFDAGRARNTASATRPDQYGAIHFHDDDLDDCRWPATHAVTMPDGFKSDAYALLLRAGDASRRTFPFFVVPPLGPATARIAVLVSTYTYTDVRQPRPARMDDRPRLARRPGRAEPRPGTRTRTTLANIATTACRPTTMHTDGSGIALVSWRRPMLNLRIGYVTYPYPDIRGSGLRHYPADSHLLMWLVPDGPRRRPDHRRRTAPRGAGAAGALQGGV
jgi:hypothetical protein